jgi:glycerophosphoryl diester phosphodiesterase
MKSRRSLIIGALILLGLVLIPIFRPDAPSASYYLDVSRPLVIAHQGGDGIWPGDTMYAFEKAVEIGADVLEMDAHITKESQIVLMHDETVDGTTDGTGLIEDLTMGELKQLDAAYRWTRDDGKTYPYRGQEIRVPALEEVFQKFPQMRYVIEIKMTEHPIAQPLCDLIRGYHMQDKVMIASFHDTAMQNFRETCPEVATSASPEVALFCWEKYSGGSNAIISPFSRPMTRQSR